MTTTLLIGWAALQFFFLWLWRTRRTRETGWLAGAWLLAGAAAAGISYLVVTPTEQIIATCEELAGAIDAGDLSQIEPHLAGEFEAAGLDRADFVESVGAALSRYRVDRPRLSGFEVEFPTDSTAVATFGASCRVRTHRLYGQVPSRWKVRFRKAGDAWLLTGIQSLPVPPLNVADLRQFLR